MISDSTQCADVAWYSKRLSGAQFSRQRPNASSSLPRSPQCSGANGANGNPLVCSRTCSTVTTSLPLLPNSGTISATRSSSRSSPSSNSSQTAAATTAFVHEKMQYSVSSVAGFSTPPCTARPYVLIPASLPFLATATCALGSTPSSTSRFAPANNA